MLVGKQIDVSAFSVWDASLQAEPRAVSCVGLDGPCYGLFPSPDGAFLATLSKPCTWSDRGQVDFCAWPSLEDARPMVQAMQARELRFPVKRWDMIVAEMAWSADSSLVAVLVPLYPGALLHLIPANNLSVTSVGGLGETLLTKSD